MDKPTCGTCTFWQRTAGVKLPNVDGSCHYGPPIALDAFVGVRSDRWCGQHQPAAPEPVTSELGQPAGTPPPPPAKQETPPAEVGPLPTLPPPVGSKPEPAPQSGRRR